MSKKISPNPILNFDEDFGYDPVNGLPHSLQHVQDILKKTVNRKAGHFYYDQNTGMYYVFSTEADRITWQENREEHANLVIGQFEAPATYQAEINMVTSPHNSILEGTKDQYLDYTFDIKNKSGGSTGESVIASYTFSNGGSQQKFTAIYNSGEVIHFNIDNYLTTGTNYISVVITGRNTNVSTMSTVTFTVTKLNFTSDFDFSKPVTLGGNFEIPYQLEGYGLKYVEWYIDGVLQEGTDAYTEPNAKHFKTFNTSSMGVGPHSIQGRTYITSGQDTFYGNTLYFDVVVKPNGGWQTPTTLVLFGMVLDSPVTGGTVVANAIQYKDFSYKVAMHDSEERSLHLAIKEDNVTSTEVTMYPEQVEDREYVFTAMGNHTLTFVLGDNVASKSMSVQVAEGDSRIREVTESMRLKLSAKSRSNQETNPAKWEFTPDSQIFPGSSAVTTTFNNFKWNAQSGWNNGALLIQAGSSIDISYNPFNRDDIKSTGLTFEIDYEAFNITNENASILSIINNETHAGIDITSSSVKLTSSAGESVDTKFKSGDKMHLAMIIQPVQSSEKQMIQIINNGIIERAAIYNKNSQFNVAGDTIHIGCDSGCDIKLYSVRVYQKAFNVEEGLSNYVFDSLDPTKIVERNDILDGDGKIDKDKVNTTIPIMLLTGDMTNVFNATNKKANSTNILVEYFDMQNPERNFKAVNATFYPQGTSSLAYPRKNLRLYTGGKKASGCTVTDYNGEVLPKGKYAFKEGSQPVNCWTFKADYAESSGSHNTGVARMWNNLMFNAIVNNSSILRTQAQSSALSGGYPYDVRTTVDGFPVVVFHRQSPTDKWTCLGQYNFNNDKSTEGVFGFEEIKVGDETVFDNKDVQCYEFLANGNDICLFNDVDNWFIGKRKDGDTTIYYNNGSGVTISEYESLTGKTYGGEGEKKVSGQEYFTWGWEDAFESRYPDGDKGRIRSLYELAVWINSCKNDQEKWNDEKADHFDVPKLAAYYVYLMRFGALDQVVKNSMLETEDGQHWFFINYDNDTILGIDNASHVMNAWNYERDTKIPGQDNYYYAGHDSVLWNCFEADPSCMSMVRTVDASLYNAGLTYDGLNHMFDNEQCDKWCERIYNDNADFKYIQPALLGGQYLYMLQGSRKSYRHWWMQHRMDMFDSKWGTGGFKNRMIEFKSYSGSSGTQFVIKAGEAGHYGYGINSVEKEFTPNKNKNEVVTFTLADNIQIGDPVRIYNGNNVESVDLSNFKKNLDSVDLSAAVGTDGSAKLKTLILSNGDGSTSSGETNSRLTAIGGIASSSGVTTLEEIDVRDYKQLVSLNLTYQKNLHKFRASNSLLSSFEPAPGVTLTELSLPSTVRTLKLDGVTMNFTGSTISGLSLANLRDVSLKNVSGRWNEILFVKNWIAAISGGTGIETSTLELTDFNWTSGADATLVIEMGLLYSRGHGTYHGRIVLDSMTNEEYNIIRELFGDNVYNPDSQFYVTTSDGKAFIGGPESLKETQSGQFVATCSDHSQNITFQMIHADGHTPVSTGTTAGGELYYYDDGVTLYSESGIITVSSGMTSFEKSYNIYALPEHTHSSDPFTFTAVKLTYPNAVVVSGQDAIVSGNSYSYSVSLNPSTGFTADPIDYVWTINGYSGCTVEGHGKLGASVVVSDENMPTTAETATLTCSVQFLGGHVMSQSKQITVCYTYPTSGAIKINNSNSATTYGTMVIQTGDTRCHVEFNPSVFTIPVEDSQWSIATINEQGQPGSGTPLTNVSISYVSQEGHILIGKITVNSFTQGGEELFVICKVRYKGMAVGTGIEYMSRINFVYKADVVDLELPSGLLWRKMNLGAVNETDYGLYYSWGNCDGHGVTGTTCDYNFSQDNYDLTSGSTVQADLGPSYDAATQALGNGFRMPSRNDFVELFNEKYTSNEWVMNYKSTGVNGRLVTSRINGQTLFFPAGGYVGGTKTTNKYSIGDYWSMSIEQLNRSYMLHFYSGRSYSGDISARYYGRSVRAVQ